MNAVFSSVPSDSVTPWREQIARYCVGNSRLVIAGSFAFSAAVRVRLKAEPVSFHFAGPSATGKTLALWVASSVWDGKAHPFAVADEPGMHRPFKLGKGVSVVLSASEAIGERVPGCAFGGDVLCVPSGLGMVDNLHGFPAAAQFLHHIGQASRQIRHAGPCPGAVFAQWLDENAQHWPAELARLQSEVMGNHDDLPDMPEVLEGFAQAAAAGELATLAGLTGWPEREAIRAAVREFFEL